MNAFYIFVVSHGVYIITAVELVRVSTRTRDIVRAPTPCAGCTVVRHIEWARAGVCAHLNGTAEYKYEGNENNTPSTTAWHIPTSTD